MINKDDAKKAIAEKVDSLFDSYTDESKVKARENLKRDLFYLVDNADGCCYVFDKYYEDDSGEIVDITYFQHSAKYPEEEYIEHMYEYCHYFMEVHAIYDETKDEYNEHVIIYANNNCDRGCCSTWKILDVII